MLITIDPVILDHKEDLPFPPEILSVLTREKHPFSSPLSLYSDMETHVTVQPSFIEKGPKEFRNWIH